MPPRQGFEINWIPLKSKWPGKCHACGYGINQGDSIYWNTISKEIRHEKCLDKEFYNTLNQKQYWKGNRS